VGRGAGLLKVTLDFKWRGDVNEHKNKTQKKLLGLKRNPQKSPEPK